ncbi:MAG: hypothetical protein K0Q95_3128 [Bacteroidota bacterium]|jgi:hypothetical protein|nr:hypothetical protein [Bacteroidota bacterium]
MKKVTLLIILICSLKAYSQNVSADTTKKDFKNAIGIDASTFVRQFFISNNTSLPVQRFPTILSYRRFIKSSALKIAAGAYVQTTDNTTNDSVGNKTENSGYCIRLGYEHYSYLGKRWMYYFGADLIYAHSKDHSDTHFSTTSASEYTTIATDYGISPLLGINFQITERLSIASEASFDVAYEMGNTKSTAFPSGLDTHRSSNKIITTFNALQLINLRIKF